MLDAYFFGYGSLVNSATHEFQPVYPATLRGWRRAWVARPERALCYLSAVSDPEGHIDGLIAPVPQADWSALDMREAAYQRHMQAHAIDHESPAAEIAVYAVAPSEMSSPGSRNPILLSYLDTVIEGFQTVYGDAGVAAFFATTAGWTAPILDDRASPQYRRATQPGPNITSRVDAALGDLGCNRILA